MNSFEFNKIFAAFLLAGLIACWGGFLAEELMHPHMPENPAYYVEVPEGGPAPTAPSAAPSEPESVLLYLAGADVTAGQRLTRACTACHSFEKGGSHKVGPNLWGVVGSDIAHHDNFSYSAAMAGKDGNWNYEFLGNYLSDPKRYVPGTKMVYRGLKDVQDRANLIAYLRTQSDSPIPLPDVSPLQQDAEEMAGEDLVPEDALGGDDVQDSAPLDTQE